LGIVGAHALLLEERPSKQLLQTVIRNLRQLVRGHPDVVALERLVDERLAHTGRSQPVDWPPLLRKGYPAVIRLHAEEGGMIKDRSPAESFASFLNGTSVWTTWRAAPASSIHASTPPPAVSRVTRYLEEREAVAAEEPLDPRDVALATGLPVATAER